VFLVLSPGLIFHDISIGTVGDPPSPLPVNDPYGRKTPEDAHIFANMPPKGMMVRVEAVFG
jgi:hypothetical protein